MSYFLGEKPLDTKGTDRTAEVQQAIESDAERGATEVKRAPEKLDTDQESKIAEMAIQNDVVYATSGRSQISRQEQEIKVKKDKLSKKASKEEKHKDKTHFPPGLVVSEKAKAKMEEQQAKIAEKQREKAAKKLEQEARWQSRADVVARWKKWEERQQAVKDKILAKWDARDKKLAEKRAARLAKLADKPVELEKEKKKIAEQDVQERLKRAKYLDLVEAKQLKALKRREHAQVRRDKMYNFFGGFLGWEKRAIPNIPASTLKDWAFEGFEDLGTVDTKLSLVIIALVAYAIFASTKPKVVEPVAAKKRKRKRRK